MLPHSRGTAERVFSSHFPLCNTQLISLRLQQWQEIMPLRDGRICYVHMSCERSCEGAGRLHAFGSPRSVIQPLVPPCLGSLWDSWDVGWVSRRAHCPLTPCHTLSQGMGRELTTLPETSEGPLQLLREIRAAQKLVQTNFNHTFGCACGHMLAVRLPREGQPIL